MVTRSTISYTQSSHKEDQKRLKDALALQKAGKLEDAKEIYLDLTTSVHSAFDAHHMLGVLYASQQDYGKALYHGNEALRHGESADLRYNLALIAWRTEKIATMQEHAEELAKIAPNDVRVYPFYARYDLHHRQYEKALVNAELAQKTASDASLYIGLYCRALVANNRYAEALSILRQKKEPSYQLLYAQYLLEADIHAPQNQKAYLQEAEDIFLKLVVTEKNQKLAAKAQASLAKLSEKRFDDDSMIEKRFRHALRLDPSSSMHRMGLSFSLLKQKKWLEGFALLQSRKKLPAMQAMLAQYAGVPELTAKEDLLLIEGCHVVVLSEQGIGDNLQFMRFIPFLQQYKPSCISLHVPLALKSLAASLDGVQHIVSDGDTLHEVNFVIPMMSLPSLFKSDTIEKAIASTFYLHPVGEAKTQLPAAYHPLKVGIAWQGNIHFAEDNRRSIPFDMIHTLLSETPVTFYGLQKPTSAAFQELAQQHPHLIDVSEALESFNDTAHFVKELDLVISVDTSLLHLAGVMGVKAIGLIPPVGDWRWHKDKISTWYPSLTLIRAQKNWQDAIEQLCLAIQNHRKHNSKSMPPRDFSDAHQKILSLLEASEWHKALQEAKKITSIEPQAEILHLQGIAALKTGDIQQAISCLKKGLAQEPSPRVFLDILHDLISLYTIENQQEKALIAFLNALEKDLFNQKTLRLILRYHKESERLALCIRKKRRKYKQHILLEQAQVYLYIHAQKFVEAEAILESIDTQKQGMWTKDYLLSLLAGKALEAAQRAIAKKAMAKAIESNPQDPLHQMNYNLILVADGELNRAILNLRNAINKNPNPRVSATLSQLLIASGQKEQAQSILHTALLHHPQEQELLEMKKNIDSL